MPKMTDPTDALVSLQHVLPLGGVPIQRCDLDRDLYVVMDEPAPHVVRMTYVRLEGAIITAMVSAASCGFIDGRPGFQLGYAVPPAYRGQGRAKDVVQAAIREMANGYGRAGILPIIVEAVVGVENEASRRVAAAVLKSDAELITDAVSGLPAYRFVHRIA